MSTPPLTAAEVAPGLEPVAHVFTTLLESGRELGAALSVHRGGRELLSVSGGWSDTARTSPFTPATLVQVFSAGKPIAAAAALTAVADGILTLDDPIGRWWPEYAAAGKQSTTLRHLLSHRAGLPGFSTAAATIDALDRDALIADLVAAAPVAPPGEVIAEHALTYGHLIEGLLAAAGAPDARSAAARLGELTGSELRFGVPPAEQHRVADLEILDATWVDRYLARDDTRHLLETPTGHLDPARLNTAVWRAASLPASGLFTTATSLARFYDDLHRPDGAIAGRLGSRLHAEYLSPQAVGHDLFIDGPVEWSLGLRVDDGEIGMGGIGGSCAWYSPAHDYSFAFVTRSLAHFDRVDALADALESALAA
ncbi:serine hydrolase domain-containing protein [Herbiconiux liangxiaofengii]|uniref:serine hydrolase domain-containing protein n=1 Tax=Herbiconiux liangxiaofengii TaxID=3342795 RepID=UPI0035B7EBB1